MFTGATFELETEVAYYERSRDGFYERISEFNVRLDPTRPLHDAIFEKLGTMDEQEDKETNEYSCFAGNFEGKEIDMQLPPSRVQYLQDTLRTSTKPMLYLYKQCRGTDISGGLERKPSTLAKDLIGSTDSDEDSAFSLREMLDDNGFKRSVANKRKKISLPSYKSLDTGCEPSTLEPHPKKLVRRAPIVQGDEDIENAKMRAVKRFSFIAEGTRIADEDSEEEGPNGSHLPSPVQLLDRDRDDTPFSESLDTKYPAKDKYMTLNSRQPAAGRTKAGLSKMDSYGTLPITREKQKAEVYPRRRSDSAWERRRAFKVRKKSTFSLASINLSSLKVQIASGHCATVKCDNFTTIGELRQSARQLLIPAHPVSDYALALTYESEDGELLELFNESQLISNTQFFESFSDSILPADQPPILTASIVRLKQLGLHPKEEILMHTISQLTGVQLDLKTGKAFRLTGSLKSISNLDQEEEVKFARRTLSNYVAAISESRDPLKYALSMEVSNSDAPLTLSLLIPIGNLVPVNFRYKDVFSFTKNINLNKKAEDVLAEVFPCVVACGLVEDDMEKYVLQFSGEDSYIHGSYELIVFRKIRRCVMKSEAINLSLTEKPNLDLYTSHKFECVALDPLTREPPTHGDLVASSQHTSLWECSEALSVKVVRAENLPFLQRGTYHVQLSLYHGFSILSSRAKTTCKAMDQYHIVWNEDLNLGIQLKNLPKAAKILVKVVEGSSRLISLGSSSKKQSMYFWGLISVFDHYGKLRRGSQSLHLWPGGERAEDAVEMNIAAPPANNYQHSAVCANIEFGCPREVIHFPSVARESRDTLYKRHPSVRNIQLRRAFGQYAKDKFSAQDKPYHRLATHISCLDWDDLTHCLQVFALLEDLEDDIGNIPFYIALKLLDSDFPDENVRGFATKVLEQLPDEQLEDFLLQLTQALKFERCHDSPLARFLLKRALRNKTIGHFLFWYLRSELHHPQYRARFAVILEAYLKGCGEAMLRKFTEEIGSQAILEQIGVRLKQDFDSDLSKMQQGLMPILKENKVDKLSFTPIYNPKISVGKVQISKCKIMSSARKPMWLEMQNVHPTSICFQPVGMILKLGDDLRQDMITLKMLSLFEKLWAHQGLDLHLIPYGCIATGDKTGYIEVVKNAKTISEVSGIRNNVQLLEWIKSHQKNEFGEEDPDMVKAAVKRFTFSCAGYSIATYVLGIGDRHNDNVMVTTSGNLFHIDFGHFLGNIKRIGKFLKREWAPFVLTPDFVHVMGGEGSSTFEMYKNLCCRAFLILRRNSDLIINLFSMMRSTGLPELTCVEDTDYIKTVLVLGKSEVEAEASFRNTVIQSCLDLKWTVQAMWWLHKAKHGKRS